MRIDPTELSRRDRYQLFISSIVPRPIGWVSTISPDGVPNLAPFSFFNGVTSDPLTLSVAIARRRGEPKDTIRNIEATRELVVNVVEEAQVEEAVQTSADLPFEVNEFETAGLQPGRSELVAPPRVLDAPVAMECRLDRIVEVGNGPTSLVLAQVLLFHVRDDIVDEEGRIDPTAWTPMARMGGQLYAPVREIREIPRPG
jgi:flavin reductase (DIM6/NTAB) family NADH-FMN oxidoreductase RutF